MFTYVYWGGGWPWATHGRITLDPFAADTLRDPSLILGGTAPWASEKQITHDRKQYGHQQDLKTL